MRKLILASCIFASAKATAQNAVDLNPVTITATRAPQKISETGRNISVIAGDQFQHLPVSSIDELLKYVPGVEVQSRGPMGAQSDIVMRGGTFQQVLVLIDGIKLNDPLTGHFSSYTPVAPFEIERIEILRGPAAAIYGAEAVGGVINIITKTFNQFNKEKNTSGNVNITAGEYKLLNADAGMRITGNKINAAIGLLSNNTGGQLLRGDNRGYLHNHTLSGSIAFALKKNWQLSLRSSIDKRDFAAQNFYTTFASDTATEKVNSWWNQVQLKKQTEKSTRQFDVLYKQAHDNYLYNPASIANDNRSNLLILQYLYATTLNKYVTLNIGTQLDRRGITSNDRGDHATHHGAVFGTALFNVNKFRISPGLRGDWDENYGAVLLPQLNTAYLLKNITLRANAGKAIRSADFTERFNNYNKKNLASGTVGNPDLGTENSWSYEAGADVYLASSLKLSATGFYRDQNNVIDYVATPYEDMPRKENLVPGSTYALAKNLKKVTTKGIETELSFQHSFSKTNNLYITTGVTFLKSASSDGVASFYIISHARTLIQSTFIYSNKKINLATNFVYKNRGAQQASAINASLSKDYFLLNAKLSYRFCSMAGIFISVNNITDIHYSDLLGSIMPGRWTTGGLNLTF